MEKIFLSASNKSDGFPFQIVLSGITYPDPDYKIYRKCSELYVIESVEKGEGTVICDGKRYRVQKGDAYLLPAGSEHRYYSDKHNPWEKKWINAAGALCETLVSTYGIGKTVFFPQCPIGDLFDEFFDICTKSPTNEETDARGAVIFHRMIQRLAENAEKKVTPIEEVRRYIDGNVYNRLTAEAVARRSGFSVSQLGRLFKKAYGTTVYAYILEQKIQAAEKLLKNSSLSLRETADMLGFTDEHYFCNIFQKKRGITPGRFRKN